MATGEHYGTMTPEMYEEYTSGKLSPAGMRMIEEDVAAGKWDISPGMVFGKSAVAPVKQAPAFDRSVPSGDSTTSVQLAFQPSQTPAPTPSPQAPTPTPGAPPPPPPVAEETPENPEDAIPSWTRQPEFWKTILGSVSADTEQAKKIITNYDPSIKVRQGNEGATIFTRKDGTEFAMRPGMTLENAGLVVASTLGTAAASALIGSVLTAVAPSLPIIGPIAAKAGPIFSRLVSKIPGGLRSILGGAAEGIKDQALMSAGQVASGGEFRPSELATAGLGGGFIGAIPQGRQAAKSVGRDIEKTLLQSRPNPVETAGDVGAAALLGSAGDFQAGQDLARVFDPDQAALQAGKTLGIEVPLAAATKNPDVAQVLNTLGNEASGSLLAKQSATAARKLDDQVVRSLRSAGVSAVDETDLAAIVNGVKDYGTYLIEEMHRKAKDIYDNLKIKKNTPVDPTPVLKFINSEAKNMVVKGSEETGREYLQSPLMKKVLDIVDPASKAAQKELPTWYRLDTLRKLVDDAAHNTGPFRDDPNQWIAAGLTKRLNQVLDKVAENAGELEALNRAKGFTKSKYALIKTQKELFGKKLQDSLVQKIQGAASGLLRKDPTEMGQILAKIPKDRRNEVVTAALTDLMEGAPSSKFVELWKAIEASPTTGAVIFPNLKLGARDSLRPLYNLASAFERAKAAGRISSDAMHADPSTLDQFMNWAMRAMRIGTLSLPWRWAGASRMFLTLAKDPNDPKIRAVRNWLAAPETRDVLVGLAKGTPKPLLVRRMTETTPFKQLRRFVDMGPDGLKWMNRGLQAATTGSSMAPEEEE